MLRTESIEAVEAEEETARTQAIEAEAETVRTQAIEAEAETVRTQAIEAEEAVTKSIDLMIFKMAYKILMTLKNIKNDQYKQRLVFVYSQTHL